MIVEKLTGKGTTSRRERMRCKDCRKRKGGNGRFTLPKPAKEYVSPVLCPKCGSDNVASNETYERKRLQKRVEAGHVCLCENIPFRHTKGSLRFCAHNVDMVFGVEPTEEEIAAHQAMLATKRHTFEWGTTERKAANDEDDKIPF